MPRSFPPAAGWSADGHRIKAELDYSRGPEKVWVYEALRVRDGQALTFTSSSRNTVGHLQLLERIAAANPDGGRPFLVFPQIIQCPHTAPRDLRHFWPRQQNGERCGGWGDCSGRHNFAPFQSDRNVVTTGRSPQ